MKTEPEVSSASEPKAEVRAGSGNEAPEFLDPAILSARAFHEAPMLANRVAAGELPPVSERLPENPLVIRPMEEIGRYGGTLRRALTGDVIQTAGLNKTLSDSIMGWERPLPRKLELNLAESYEFQDEGRIAIFHIREGIKWSDGHPFTVDDIFFWYNDMEMDTDARSTDPVPPSRLMVGGKPMTLEKFDDYTFKVTAAKPMGYLLEAFADNIGARPKHTLAKFHPRYNKEATYEDFREKTTNAQLIISPDIPQLTAWHPVEWIRGQRIEYARNPYYWKVDTAGNQLPYIDKLVFTIIPNPEVIALKFMNGELDLYGRYSRIDLYGALKQKETEGKIRVLLARPARAGALYLNWDTPKQPLREAFRNKQVRIALSHAINREEISALAYNGLLDPAGYSFGPLNPYFSEEAYRRYSQYDPEKAKGLLEKAGYRDSDGDGYREFKDGSRFELTFDIVSGAATGADGVKVCELISEHWREVGVKANLNVALRDIIWPRRQTGVFDIHFWLMEGPMNPVARQQDWAITQPSAPFWHRNASTEGPEWLFEATRQLELAVTTIDEEEKRKAMIRLRDLHTENVPVIALGSAAHVWGASTRLGNVPEEITAETVFRGWSRPVFHEQLFIREN